MTKWLRRTLIRFLPEDRHLAYLLRQEEREAAAKEMVATVSRTGRIRFDDRVLVRLLDAGWYEGRSWDAERLEEYLSTFHLAFPPVARALLQEFGGLDIGFRGRTILFGAVPDYLSAPKFPLSQVIDERLFPIGVTNIFEDDGLRVLIDATGNIYVDGATGCDPPKDYRLDLMSLNGDSFLGCLFSEGRFPPLQSWYYSATSTP